MQGTIFVLRTASRQTLKEKGKRGKTSSLARGGTGRSCRNPTQYTKTDSNRIRKVPYHVSFGHRGMG